MCSTPLFISFLAWMIFLPFFIWICAYIYIYVYKYIYTLSKKESNTINTFLIYATAYPDMSLSSITYYVYIYIYMCVCVCEGVRI